MKYGAAAAVRTSVRFDAAVTGGPNPVHTNIDSVHLLPHDDDTTFLRPTKRAKRTSSKRIVFAPIVLNQVVDDSHVVCGTDAKPVSVDDVDGDADNASDDDDAGWESVDVEDDGWEEATLE